MRLFRKESNSVEVLCFPDEEAEVGDYLLVEDHKSEKSLLVQVIDIQFANLPGIMEDLLRDCMNEGHVFGDDCDPLGLTSQISLLRDARILLGKIRCSLENRTLGMSISWLPSRTASTIHRLKPDELFEILKIGKTRPINVGDDGNGCELRIDAEALDGGISIISGRKGTGKSHLSKLLLLGLIDHGAPCIVFDVNGEYVNLGKRRDGGESEYHDRVIVLEACRNFKVTLSYAGMNTLSKIMTSNLGLPDTSLREFQRVWRDLERRGSLCLRTLRNALQTYNLNEHVREALLSRFSSLNRSGLFTDDDKDVVRVEELCSKISEGGAIILNMSKVPSTEKKIVVEFVLGKLVELLKEWKIRAMFLFAEEAHLYLRDTYWEDIITRMRHLGLFTVFITNQPDSIQESIYRQADSIFLFNFKNEHDLNAISKVTRIDGETMKSIAQTLQPHHCLTVGQVTKDIPLVIRVKPLDISTMGETRKFFK